MIEILNYKEHPSKFQSARTCQKLWSEMDAHNFGPLHDVVTGFTGVCNSSSSALLLSSNSDSLDTTYSSSEWSFSSLSSAIVGYNIDCSLETICIIVVTCSIMFMVFVSFVIETVCYWIGMN
ncbi:hypothetical protein M9H77_18154 [Catharanthus roseus]|uniref:Uncharacterized protein n=1 Tax=Catharanthus roseus TaxID=4058 RepID=A0ACC0B6M5_CATRO|nr:hypothetical protein M9H77_18154 [Catharanthus roseus]